MYVLMLFLSFCSTKFFQGEDEELFEMPPLGKHYTEVWADEDRVAAALKGPNGAYPPIKPTVSRNNNPYAAFTDTVPPSAGGSLLASNAGARWDPATLTEQDAITEEHGSGPLTERIFSSFLLIPGAVNQEDEDTSRGFGLGRASGQGTVGDLEERLMRECKALGLFQESGEVSRLEWSEAIAKSLISSLTILKLKTIKLLQSCVAVSVHCGLK